MSFRLLHDNWIVSIMLHILYSLPVWEVEIEGKIFTLNLLINPIQIFIQIHLFIHCRNFNPFRNSLPFTFLTQIKYFTLNTFKILARVAFFHIYKLNFTQYFSNIEYIFYFESPSLFLPSYCFIIESNFKLDEKKNPKEPAKEKYNCDFQCARVVFWHLRQETRVYALYWLVYPPIAPCSLN